MAETNKLLEETANYLLSHCFLLGGVEDQRSKYLYVQDHLNEVRAVFAPLGYAVLLYPAPLQAAALVNEHEGSQARLLKYESILLLVLRLRHPYPLLPSSRRSFRAPVLPLRRHPLPPLVRPRARAVCLGTVVLPLRRPSLRPRRPPSPPPLRLPHLPPCRHLSPSPTLPLRLLPPVLPRRPRSRMPESCSANGPRLSSVSRRVRLPTQGFCSTPVPRPTTAPSSPSRSPRARPLPSRCSVAPIRSRWSCRRSARSSVVAPSTTSWMGVARRLLNMRSILHLHGLRHLRTRNPCPRRPLHPRAPARRSQKRHR